MNINGISQKNFKELAMLLQFPGVASPYSKKLNSNQNPEHQSLLVTQHYATTILTTTVAVDS